MFSELKEKGYTIIYDVLNSSEIEALKQKVYRWQKSIPNYEKMHKDIDPHGIHKFHNAGHTDFAWELRTHPAILNIFSELWKTKNLIVSYDGSCYMSEKSSKKDGKCWTHTDQAQSKPNLECYQSFISLTNNKSRTLVVYESSHTLHKRYFDDRKIKSSKDWYKIDPEYLKEISHLKRTLEVPAGALVIWDSRTFHQNQYGTEKEERIVQYLCYLPRNHKKNTEANQRKRLKYFNEKRTTSHWPCPIRVNGKQPQTYGDDSKKINYELLRKEEYSNLEEIMKLI